MNPDLRYSSLKDTPFAVRLFPPSKFILSTTFSFGEERKYLSLKLPALGALKRLQNLVERGVYFHCLQPDFTWA